MELLANDLSIHGQFHDMPSFRKAFAELRMIRETARRFGRELYCHSSLLTVEAMPDVPMRQALAQFTLNERRAAMSWLTKSGPFWDDLRQHGADDYLECRGEVVTDSAVGEAAYRTLHAVDCGLVSFTPSDWNFSPIEVTWRREGRNDRGTALENWWDAAALESRLQDAAPPVRSWDDLRRASTSRFTTLTFAGGCFDPLAGTPFSNGAAERILVLLDILDRSARAFDATGERTSEGHRLHRDYFTGGDNAWFSDSSETEKRKFRQDLTFRHPDDPSQPLFCPWHGKVSNLTLRLHFSWSLRFRDPVLVTYVGPKITKQ